MNTQQAKRIPLVDILARLGYQPVKEVRSDLWYLSPFRLIGGLERALPAQMRWSIATTLVVRGSVAPGRRQGTPRGSARSPDRDAV